MTRARLRELAALLPPDAPYFLATFGSERPITLSERCAAAESDPTFHWNLIHSYVQAGKPLPDLAWPEELLRVWRHLSDPDHYDENLVEAEMLNLPENQRTRDLTRALLSCRGVTDEYIASLLRCEVEVVRLFHLLFWHVRPFLDDPQYLLDLQDLLDPGASARTTGPEQPQALLGHKLLTRAIETGDPTAVLAVAGISLPGATTVSPGKLAEEIEREVTALAVQDLAQGVEDPKRSRPLYLYLRHLLGRNRERTPREELLFGLQLTPADLQPTMDDLNQRLALECPGSQPGTSGQTPAAGTLKPGIGAEPKGCFGRIREQILDRAKGLPKASPFFRLTFREQPGKFESATKAERLWACLNDPGFGGHVAESYASARLPLSPSDWPSAIIRAYHWLAHPDAYDPDMALAWELNQPQNRLKRDFLRALHLCRDETREQLATRAGLSLPVFTLFGELHFNAQDRLDEPVYLAEICRQAGVDPAIDVDWASRDRGLRAIWVASQTGSSELVQRAYAGIRSPLGSKPTQVLHADIEKRILYRAALGLRGGETDKEGNPLLEPALKIVVRKTPANAAQVTREGGPTPALAIQLTLDGVPRSGAANPAGVQSDRAGEPPCVPPAGPDQS